MSELWEYDKYTVPEGTVLYNTEIFEYDIRSANTSLAREFKLLPEDMIRKLETLPKKSRVVEVGLYKKDHKEYNENEKHAFAEARHMFFDKNEIDPSRIVSIKRDAIFMQGRVKHTRLTKNIEFRVKNEYEAFINLKPLELYYTSGKPLDVKGMNSDMYIEHHHPYFGGILEEMFVRLQNSEMKYVHRYLRDVFDKYVWRELPGECYREFNPLSRYLYMNGMTYDILTDIEQLDIGYNMKILTKVIGLLM